MKKTAFYLVSLSMTLIFSVFSGCTGEGYSDKANPPTDPTVSTTPSSPQMASASTPAAPAQMNVDVSELLELMEEEPGLQLLDVRRPEETAEGTIKGAAIANVHDADFETRASAQLDKSKPVVVYCASGKRSSSAIPRLREQGFTILYNLKGGVNAWTTAGRPLSK